MIVSYAVSDSEDEENNSDSEPQPSVVVKAPIKGNTIPAEQKSSNSLPKENTQQQTSAESTVVNGTKINTGPKSVTEDETASVPFTFSTQIEDMLSGLPPPKKKKVTISETFLSNSSISASLSTLTKKNAVSGMSESSKQGSSKEGASSATKVVDSDDDSDTEASATGTSTTEKAVNGVDESVEGSISGLRFENALLKMLPKARTTVDLKKAAQLMVPDSVKNKQKTMPQKGAQKAASHKTTEKISSVVEDEEDIEDNNTSSVSYFNFMDPSESASCSTDISTHDYYKPRQTSRSSDFGEDSSQEHNYPYASTFNDNTYNRANSEDQMTALNSLNTADDLDPEVLQRLQGRRKDEFIEIKDVSAEDQLQDVSIEITKGLSEEQDQPCDDLSEMSKKDKNDPSQRRAKSKHQINWLVSQAKSREVALKNQWASNRMNRKATQMKYGF